MYIYSFDFSVPTPHTSIISVFAAVRLQDNRKFAQRYYEYVDQFRIPDGPIFLNICGESACNGIVNDYISVSLMTN